MVEHLTLWDAVADSEAKLSDAVYASVFAGLLHLEDDVKRMEWVSSRSEVYVAAGFADFFGKSVA